MSFPRATLAAAVSLLVVAGCRSEPATPPNVLLIVVDTLRQDHLGCYGWTRDTSPSIDALAQDAVRFTRAYATAPWTLPSVASMLTGLYPSSHRGARLTTRLPGEVLTLAEMLGEEGYQTGGVVSHTILTARWNFQQGYDVYLQSEALGHDHASTPGVTRQAEELLREFSASERPFFLFVHYFDPHYNYLRHPEFGFAPPSAGRLVGDEPITELRDLLDELTVEEIRFIRDLYDEEIRYTDSGVGQLLRTLKGLGLYENTLIVFTADHGEEFLTHGWLGHTRTLYDELMRVPLIVREPGNTNGPRVVEEPVSLVSLTPTILDLAGIESPAPGFQGRSLAPLMSNGDSEGSDIIFLEVDFVPVELDDAPKTTHKKGIVTGDFKLIREDRTLRYELYDLASDPQELNDLAARRPGLVEEMVLLLHGGITFSRGMAVEFEEMRLSEEQIEKLRSLGYIGQP